MILTRLNTRFANPLFRDFDAFFRELTPNPEEARAALPATDIVETDKAIELRVDLPGVDPENIDVKLEGHVLTLSAERKEATATEKPGLVRQERVFGRFTRAFTLPEVLEGTTPEASYKHGVLTVTLPKKELAQPRSVKVKVQA